MLTHAKAFSSFSVDDIAQAKDFYGRVLELGLRESTEGLGLMLAGGAEVFLYPKPNHVPATFTVLNFRVADIDTTVDVLTNQGVKMEHYDSEYLKTDAKGVCRNDGKYPGPKAIAWFTDPAGNILSVIQER